MNVRIKRDIPEPLNRAVKKELTRQAAEWAEQYNIDMYATILWTLHERFGFGRERLKIFFDDYLNNYQRFTVGYDYEDTYAERLKLKNECGVDVEEWMRNADMLKGVIK